MSSLWRVLALAWLGSAGAPSMPDEAIFPDQTISRASDADEQPMIGLDEVGRLLARPDRDQKRR